MITSSTVFGHDCEPAEYAEIDPVQLLSMWIPAPGDAPPPLMALATIAEDGYPRARHVLLSEYRGGAVYFHTDATSAKVAELSVNPRAAVTVAWPEIGRQVSMYGDITSSEPQLDQAVYARRGRYLQLLAWLNTPEIAALDPARRHAAWARFDAEHPRLEPPPNWVGFALEPKELTFWRGDPLGPSQRTRYRRDKDRWTVEVLPG
ncbi:pyridoxal 5'-phosphate synthase [Nocardia sp. NPDC058176]|uniref:pyridoxine/pyridoxamine 5'-phosphate oxidase n=1 Tax=Nocardia sp. NPDC058176 TaxID=3346368 RepID=UPI0036D8EFFD